MYDSVSKVFSEMVFPAFNDDDAKRSFIDFMKNKQRDIDPLHYTLFYVGEYDRIDGNIKGLKNNHERVMSGIDFMRESDKVITLPEKEVDNEK